MIELDWYGCYKSRWGAEISQESHAHPAKFARNLIRQIYTHLLDEGLLKADDTVLDPFGGIGLGAADALRHRINWIGVELERKFVDFGGCNCTGISKEDWLRCYSAEIDKTDSNSRWERFNHKAGRHWCPLCLAEAKEIIEPISQLSLFGEKPSASYVHNSGKVPTTLPHRYAGNIDRFMKMARGGATAVLLQGDSRKLLEVLAGYGGFDGVLSSPSWGDTEAAKSASKFANPKKSAEIQQATHRAGTSQRAILDNMERANAQSYGETDVNLGNLAAEETDFVDAVITSAPYVESLASDEPNRRGGLFRDPKRSRDRTLTATYGETEGQLGQSNGDTFWSAAHLIVTQCRLLLKEGAPAVFVTKDFVKDGRRVPFSEQWVQLCETCGFELTTHIRAWLVEEQGGQYNLNGDLVTKRIERKSFFRRLVEKKGSPRIDWEDVLIFRAI